MEGGGISKFSFLICKWMAMKLMLYLRTINHGVSSRNQEIVKTPKPRDAHFPKIIITWLIIIGCGSDQMARGIWGYLWVYHSLLSWDGLVCPDDKLHLITAEICPIIYSITSITADTNIILQHICTSLLSNQGIFGIYYKRQTIYIYSFSSTLMATF